MNWTEILNLISLATYIYTAVVYVYVEKYISADETYARRLLVIIKTFAATEEHSW